MRLPISASHTLYSRREAEAGSTSNSVIGRPSKSEMLLNRAIHFSAGQSE
jgi:hypothetical protein